jgi:hypothetical protein
MAKEDLSRFLHLERPRPAGAPEGPVDPEAVARIQGVTRPEAGTAPRAAATGADLDRFGPEPEPSLQLADGDPAAPPFSRCMRCGAENGAFATRCTACEADLETAAQRESDARLWAARQEESRREAAALGARRATHAREEADEARARRELAEAAAREVGDSERRRLELEELRSAGWGGGGWGEGFGAGDDSTPAGVRLLRFIANPWIRVGVVASAIGIPLVLLAIPTQGTRIAGMALVVLGIALFSPAGWRRRRDFWW